MITRQGHIKLRLSEGRASVLAMPSGSSFDQRSIIVNDQQIVGQMFGGLENLITLSLSLSQALAYKRIEHILLFARDARVKIRLFLQQGKGGLIVFCL